MRIKMELLSDIIFGNGMSIPGAEDISVLHDEYGFPYYKGSTFKGVLREECERIFRWKGMSEDKIALELSRLFGEHGDDICNEKMTFADFSISPYVKQAILEEVTGKSIDKMTSEEGIIYSDTILDALTNIRTFTSISDEGVVKKGSLRMARCVNQGISLYGEIMCEAEDRELISEVICSVKWIGSMRNRGFGKVKLTIEEGA